MADFPFLRFSWWSLTLLFFSPFFLFSLFLPVNSAPCLCGRTGCTAASGLFCYSEGWLCSTAAITVCPVTDGSTPNSVYYKTAGIEYCPDGYDVISLAECKAATAALAPSVPSWGDAWDGPDDHKGCMSAAYDSGKGFWNTATFATSSKTPVYHSICRSPCRCALAECTVTSGLYCISSSSTCSARPYTTCAVADAKTANVVGIDCKCGSSDCNDELGKYCEAASNSCSLRPIKSCTDTDGSLVTATDIDCRCGSTDCTTSILTNLGGCTPSDPCNTCEGDCNADSDCVGSLKCFRSSSSILVPGCTGDTDICAILPTSMNGAGHPKGCPGAVYSNGAPSSGYCSGQGGSYPWWSKCCDWSIASGSCVPKTMPGYCVNRGLYCVSSLNDCSTRPRVECTITDGSTSNQPGVDCRCGSNDCNDLTGRYCVASTNSCTLR